MQSAIFHRRRGGTRLAPALVALGLALFGVGHAQQLDQRTLRRLASEGAAQASRERREVEAFSARTGIPLRETLSNGKVVLLDSIENGRPVFVSSHGLADAVSTGTNALWPGGSLGLSLSGSGLRMGIWEAGGNPDINHRELVGRIDILDGNFFFSDHATHVAGIMIATGLEPTARGMAYQAELDAYDSFNAFGEMSQKASTLRVSNHSYGIRSGFGDGGTDGSGRFRWLGDPAINAFEDYNFGRYDGGAAQYDTMLYNAPFYLPVVSSGNQRNPGVPNTAFLHLVFDPAQNNWVEVTAARDDQSLYDTISGSEQLAKNTLTVGAVQPVSSYDGPESVELAGFSSAGPADDGRIKPEIVGVGDPVLSTYNNNNYGFASGTSMSAPNVSGSLGLLTQHFRNLFGRDMRASTLKGLAVHTAKEAGNDDGPDYLFGYGLLDAEAAALHITTSFFNPAKTQEVTLGQGSTITIPVAVSDDAPFKVTISWTDPAGSSPGRVHDSRTPILVNDVDLRVRNVLTGEEFEPWVLDVENPAEAATTGDNQVDVMEQIVIAAPETGQYEIVIDHKDTLQGGSQVVSVLYSAAQPDGFSELTFDPNEVIGGVQNTVGTLRLSAPADDATSVQLISSNPRAASVPASVVVEAGEDSVSFPITTSTVRPVPGEDRVRVTVIAANSRGSESAIIDILPVGVESVELSTDEVIGGNLIDAIVTLNSPAPRNGATVTLTSDRPRVARPVRNWAYIPQGQRIARVKVRTSGVNDASIVNITASRLGSTSSAELLVLPAGLSTITANPSNAFSGQTVRLTVSLSGTLTVPAIVRLSSNNPGVLNVPATVTIPAGRRSVIVRATAGSVSGATAVDITAERLSTRVTTRVNVRP